MTESSDVPVNSNQMEINSGQPTTSHENKQQVAPSEQQSSGEQPQNSENQTEQEQRLLQAIKQIESNKNKTSDATSEQPKAPETVIQSPRGLKGLLLRFVAFFQRLFGHSGQIPKPPVSQS